MPLPIDHAGLEVLPFDSCLSLLAAVSVGRVGFVAGGEVLLPVNFFWIRIRPTSVTGRRTPGS
jgi:hypothetical protein